MASLLTKISGGKLISLISKMGQHLTVEEAEVLDRNPQALLFMFTKMREHPAFGRVKLVHGVFNDTKTVFEATMAKLKASGHDPSTFTWIGSQDAPIFTDDPEVAVVLNVSLGTLGDTFEFGWEWSAEHHSDLYRDEGIQSTPDKLRLFKDKDFKPLTLEWVKIKLNAHQGKSPNQTRELVKPSDIVGIEGLMVAAQHPERIRQSDGEKRPYFNLAALELCIPDSDPWSRVSGLDFDRDGRQIGLSCSWYVDDNPRWSCPVLCRE